MHTPAAVYSFVSGIRSARLAATQQLADDLLNSVQIPAKRPHEKAKRADQTAGALATVSGHPGRSGEDNSQPAA